MLTVPVMTFKGHSRSSAVSLFNRHPLQCQWFPICLPIAKCVPVLYRFRHITIHCLKIANCCRSSAVLDRDLAIGSVSVCLSVRLSHAGIDSKLTTVRFPPSGSPETLVF